MRRPLAFHSEVQGEIDEAYAWYEEKRPGLGEDFLAAVREVLDRIQDYPEIYGVLYREVRAGPLRRFPYVVYYRLEVERIMVIAVQRGSRHPRRWKSRA